MKSRLATAATLLALVVGSGGAVTLAASGSDGNSAKSAARGQYKPGKGCGDKNHKHTDRNGKPCPKLKKKHHKGKPEHHKGKPKHHKGKPKKVRDRDHDHD